MNPIGGRPIIMMKSSENRYSCSAEVKERVGIFYVVAVLGFLGLRLASAQMPSMCFDCTNLLNGRRYDFCPKDDQVTLGMAMPLACNGTCFSRGSRDDDSVIVRGCSGTAGNLPFPLPEDGCYDWNGAPICICSRPLCNIGALGESSGVALDAHLANLSTSDLFPNDEPGVLYCHQCSNFDEAGNEYAQCPRDSRLNPQMVYTGNCTGACFTRTRAGEPRRVYRGCTSSQYGLPYPLPPDGCYNWNNGDVWCVCATSRCNMEPMGTSSGYELDYHLADIDEDIVEEDGIRRCYECASHDPQGNYYPQCPKASRVRNAFLRQCNGTCFTRSYSSNQTAVTRGCTDSQYGLPYPLPRDGCYDWNGDVWCVCGGSRCNGGPMGTSSGVEMDQHLVESDEPIEEEDGVNRCFQCTNYDLEERYYPQCPKTSRVRNAYLGPCNGTCFTRSYDYNASMVARGCTDTQYNLPDPLPPDGCYTWYSDVWCVCSGSRCNGRALGQAQNIEFDAHIPKDNDGAITLEITTAVWTGVMVIHALVITVDGQV